MNQRLTVLDFTRGVVRTTSYDEWQRETSENCRKSGHVFASSGIPVAGQKCLCGDTTWPRAASGGSPRA